MENDILDALNDIGYEGPLNEDAGLAQALDGGPKSLEYTGLVHSLAAELRQLCRLEESVGLMTSPDDSSSFLLELSSFLKELGCPYRNMVTGHMSARLQSREERILLLDYLLSELMAARMLNVDKPTTTDNMKIVVQESPTAKDLKDILISLKFNKPPPNITAEVLFNKLYVKLKETIEKEGEQLVGKPLYNKALSEKQWKELEVTFAEMTEEYRLRRETLITRLECTIQSFEWSDRMKNKKEEMQSAYRARRDAMRTKPAVRLAHFLAARTALLHIEKTSSASVRAETRSELNKLIIGRVPDRGGRPSEQQPPPPEMPSWQQRAPGGGRGGGRGGDRGGAGTAAGAAGGCRAGGARGEAATTSGGTPSPAQRLTGAKALKTAVLPPAVRASRRSTFRRAATARTGRPRATASRRTRRAKVRTTAKAIAKVPPTASRPATNGRTLAIIRVTRNRATKPPRPTTSRRASSHRRTSPRGTRRRGTSLRGTSRKGTRAAAAAVIATSTTTEQARADEATTTAVADADSDSIAPSVLPLPACKEACGGLNLFV